MDNGQLLLILLVSFAIMVMIKIPIAYALGLSSMIVIIKMGLPLTSAINSMYSSVNNFSLLAVPLFMLLAQLMDKGGITDRLFAICDAFVGHIRGGLGHVNVLDVYKRQAPMGRPGQVSAGYKVFRVFVFS